MRVTRSGSTSAGGLATPIALVSAGVLAVVWVAGLADSAPREVLAAALLPAGLWVALLAWLGRRSGLPAVRLAVAFLWGAVIAAPASGELNRIAPGALSPWILAASSDSWRMLLIGPAAEELAKVVVVPLLLVAHPRGGRLVTAGLLYGALSGLGFAATENVSYLLLATLHGGMPGLLAATWSRAVVGGCKHSVYAATTGAGIGTAVAVGRVSARGVEVVAVAFAAAVLQHAAWNGLVAPRLHAVLCRGAVEGVACVPTTSPLDLLVAAPGLTLLALGPVVVALGWLARRRRGDPC